MLVQYRQMPPSPYRHRHCSPQTQLFGHDRSRRLNRPLPPDSSHRKREGGRLSPLSSMCLRSTHRECHCRASLNRGDRASCSGGRAGPMKGRDVAQLRSMGCFQDSGRSSCPTWTMRITNVYLMAETPVPILSIDARLVARLQSIDGSDDRGGYR